MTAELRLVGDYSEVLYRVNTLGLDLACKLGYGDKST